MSDFSLTTLFVAPSGTLASAGTTADLTPGQIGLFRPDYSIATSGNIAAAKYFYIAQGRQSNIPSLGSKRSDKIAASKVTEWYKVTAEDTAANEVWLINNFHVKCDDVIHLQLNLHSNLIDTVNSNGLTKTVSAAAPCCDCGELPCVDVDAQAIQDIVDKLVAGINATQENTVDGSSQNVLSTYVSASRVSSGATSGIRIESKPLFKYSNAYVPLAYPYEYDRVWFKAVAFINPDTSSDYYVESICSPVATARVTQRSTYPTGTSEEVALLQRTYQSYQTYFKEFHADGGYNQAYEDFVVPNTFYDFYYIKFHPIDADYTWTPQVIQDAAVIVYFPTGQGTEFETALTAALGAPKDQTGENVTTTTTTSPCGLSS